MENAAVEADFEAVLAECDAAELAVHIRKLTQLATTLLQVNSNLVTTYTNAQRLLAQGKAQAAGIMLARAVAVPPLPITDARLIVIAASQDHQSGPQAA